MVVKLYKIQMIWKRCGFAVYFLRRCFWRVQHATSYSAVGQHDADASCLIWIFKTQTVPFHFYNPLKFNEGQREWKSQWLGCIRIWVLHWFQLMLINAIQCHSIQLRVVAIHSRKASCIGCCWNWEVDNWSPAQDCCPREKMWFSVVGRTESVVSFFRVLSLMFLCKLWSLKNVFHLPPQPV